MSLEYVEVPWEALLDDPSAALAWGTLEDSGRKCWTTYYKVMYGFGACVGCCVVFCLGVALAPLVKLLGRLAVLA